MLLKDARFRCSALLFDMDGTLLNSHAPTVRAYTRWAEQHGLDAAHVLREAQGRRTADSLSALAPAGVDVQQDIARLMQWEREDTEGIVEIAGTAALLRSLPADRWAIVTSADRELARTRLAAAGLPQPQVMVTAEDVARGKPAPDGYLLAASRLGVAPSGCIVFEDAPAGLAAGAAAGARVIAIASPLMQGRLDGYDYLEHYRQMTVQLDGSELLLSMTG